MFTSITNHSRLILADEFDILSVSKYNVQDVSVLVSAGLFGLKYKNVIANILIHLLGLDLGLEV